MIHEHGQGSDAASVGVRLEVVEKLFWRVDWELVKYHTDEIADWNIKEVLRYGGNVLVIGGVSALFQRLIGTGVTAFDNTNAHIGVGDSTTAAVDTQTDLVAATNKLKKGMMATFPQHTDSTGTAGSKTITFKSQFTTSEANFVWQEQGIFNGGPAFATGRMLNRRVENLGTKTVGTWELACTCTIN